jgi:hypothetical protein
VQKWPDGQGGATATPNFYKKFFIKNTKIKKLGGIAKI